MHAYARLAFYTRLSVYKQGRYYSSGRNERFTTKLRWRIFSTAKRAFIAFIAVFGINIWASEAVKRRGLIDALLDSTIFHVIGPQTVPPKPTWSGHQDRIYQPLTARNEIRLLVLEPGQNKDEINCLLMNVLLTWRAQYEALSYTWGNPKITKPVRCSGKTIDVTTNLHSALRHLRYPDQQRILWVDALCINQADDHDKETQVQRMGRIYSKARRVLIWLGEDTEVTGGAIGSIKQLDSYFKALYRKRRLTNLLPAFGTWTTILSDAFPTSKVPTDFDWVPVLQLLEHPWFLRTWIIQEAVLGRRAVVINRADTVDWKIFERVCQGIGLYQTWTASIPEIDRISNANEAVKTLMIAREERNAVFLKRWFSRKEFTKMMDLLNESLDFQCSDKRDKIFGLLGIATDTNGEDEDEEIRPDYEAKVEDVYRRFVIWEIKKNASLRSLSCASDRTKSVYVLPSWVPDFSRLEHTTNLMRFENRVKFNATKNSKPQARFSEDGQILYLGGRAVDSIDIVGGLQYADHKSGINPGSDSLLGSWHLNSAWLRECIAIGLLIGNNEARHYDGHSSSSSGRILSPPKPKVSAMTEERYEAFWRTLTCNHDTKMQPAPLGSGHGAWMKRYIDSIIIPEEVEEEEACATTHHHSHNHNDDNKNGMREQQRRLSSDIQHIHAIVGLMNKGRRFCATVAGRLGLVPSSAAAGDIVCVLYGGRVPFLLRPRLEGSGYVLVGECYVHGLMDGEGVVMERVDEREFALC